MASNFKEGIPTNYEQLKNDANNKSSWKVRIEAVRELSGWKCRQSIDILWKRMMSDDVYKVQHAAFLGLQAFGERARIPRKKRGNLIKAIHKYLGSVKNSLPEEHSYAEFKEAFQKNRPVEYDTYEGDKESRFDSWLESAWKSLPKKK
ncbi:HEAT repeat domain-containing protein [Paenibacillus sp. FA6]|uniref:HEAT repeat domain-containing protein n=1 Tax=Paenibacillus sp. FA6 TaxID=3413029 RepID=UPI003F660033